MGATLAEPPHGRKATRLAGPADWRRSLRRGAFPAKSGGMQAGGIFLTLALLIGAGVGVHYGQGSLGIVVGLVVGLIAVGLFAWRDSRRRR